MNFETLKQKLSVENKKITAKSLTLSFDNFTKNIQTVFEYCYNNQDIVILKPKLGSLDEKSQSLEINGTSDFMSVPNLKLNAKFTLDKTGNVQLYFKYDLLGENPGVNDWKFSKSFPDMPEIIDAEEPAYYNRAIGTFSSTSVALLDKLYFYNASFIVSSSEMEEPESKHPIKWGINYISKLRPDGMLGIIENLFQYKKELNVHGTIRIPAQLDVPEQLENTYLNSQKRFQFPWTIQDQFPYGVPGILLAVELDMEYSLIKDELHFVGDKLYFYTPVNNDWMFENTSPSFEPMHAYTGKVLLPKANIEMDMVAPREIGMEEFTLISQFEGLSLENMAHLAGISGGESPLNHLPQEIQDMGDKLGRLSIESAVFSINYSQLSNIRVSNITFTIGIPDLNWEVWKDHFSIDSLNCEFDIDNPLSIKNSSSEEDYGLEKEVKVSVYGKMEVENVPFTVYANNEDDFTVYTEMEGTQKMPLQKILSKYTPAVKAPSDLTINVFRMGISPGNFYSFSLAMANEPNSWKIPIGADGFTVSDVTMSATHDKTSGTSGSISGKMAFGDIATLSVQYDSPGAISIRSWVPNVNLRKLLQTLSINKLPIPKVFDIELKNNYLLIQENESSFVFQTATELEGFGSLALQVQEINNQWGVAFGIDITKGNPFDLPGLSALKAFSKVVHLNKFLLIVSTFDNPNFVFPDIASFNNPTLSSTSIPMPKSAGGVIAGLNIHASWTLDTSSKAQHLLKSILGLDPTLDITLQVSEDPTENSRLYLKYETKIAGGHDLSCQFGFALLQGTPELFLEGKFDTEIGKHLCRFDVAMSLLENGMFFAGSMEGTVAIEGVQLSNLALAIGFDWEAIPSLGIAASIDTEDFDSSIAVLFDSIDPNKSLLAGSISGLTLYSIVDFFVKEIEKAEGKSTSEEIPEELEGILKSVALKGNHPFDMPKTLSNALDNMDLSAVSEAFMKYGKVSIPAAQEALLLVINSKGTHWSITDKQNDMRHYELKANGENIVVTQEAQIYIAPEGAQMGSLVYQQGFFLSGTLAILGLEWSTQIEVRKNKGIAAESEINKPLIVYKPAFFQLSDTSEKTGPAFSFSTFSQPELKDPEFQSPHLYLSGLISIVGIKEEAYIKASKEGFTFELENSTNLSLPGKVFSGSLHSDFDIHGTIGTSGHFDTGISLSLGMVGEIKLGELNLFDGLVDIDLGNVELNFDVGGNIDMGYDGKKAYIDVDAHFDFEGSTHHFSKELSADNADIKKAGEWVIDELKSIFKKMFDVAEHWVDAVKNGLVKIEHGAEQMAKVLKDGFKKVDKEALELIHYAGHDFEEIGSAFSKVYGTTAKEMSQLMHGFGAEVEQIADTLKNTFNSDAKAVAGFVNDLEHTSPEDVAKALKHSFGNTATEASKVMHSIGMGTEHIAQGLKNSFKQSAQQAVKILDGLSIHPSDLGKVLKSTFKLPAVNATRTLKNIKKDEQAIAHALKDGYKTTARQAAHLMDSVGINTAHIGKALKGVFKQSAHDMAHTFKLLKKGGKDVANVLKSVYKSPAKSCASLMQGVGYGLKDASVALKHIYKIDYKGIASTFKSLKKSANAISSAMKSAFKISSKSMTSILHQAKFTPEEMGNALKSAYKLPANEAATLLKGVGINANDVAKVLNSSYKMSTAEAGKLLKSTFNLGEDAMKSALKGAGYAANEISSFASSAFKSAKKTAKKVIKGIGHAFGL